LTTLTDQRTVRVRVLCAEVGRYGRCPHEAGGEVGERAGCEVAGVDEDPGAMECSSETASSGHCHRALCSRVPGRPRRVGIIRLQSHPWEREDGPVDRREETVVFVRVVRFTDVTAERVEALVARIDETGPPPGVPIKQLQLVFDEAQGTAVVLQYFANEENLRAGADTFAAMDRSETPGSRVSVDTGELKIEREL
jgi:hypothetical protein